MKINITKLSGLKLGLIIITGAVLILLATSCSKSDSPSSTSFAGTYRGTLTTGLFSEADTIVITAGSGSSVAMASKTGSGSTYNINGTTSGSTMTISSQSVYVANLSDTYTVSGTGTLSGSTLVINYVFVSSGGGSVNLTFTGTKS